MARQLLRACAFAALYWCCGWLSTQEADAPLTGAALVWVPAGLGIAGYIWKGPAALVGIALGSMLLHAEARADGTQAIIETCSAVLAPCVVVPLMRMAEMRSALARLYDVFVLTLVGALGTGLIDGTLTVAGRMLAEGRPIGQTEWLGCVLADALGVLVFAPAALVWIQGVRMGTTSWVEAIEVALFSLCLAMAAMTLWRIPGAGHAGGAPDGLILLVPVLLWAATRFGQRGVVTALSVACLWALAGTLHERQAFWALPLLQADRIVALQVYLGTGVLSVLVFGSIIEERRQAIRLRDDFLIVASHELKTPLTALLLGVENLQRRMKNDADDKAVGHRRKLSACHAQIDRLTTLVDGLLDVSRLSGRKLSLHRQPADLCAIVAPIVEQTRPRAESLHAELVVQLAPGLWGLWDCERIQQMVRALLDNACKYGAGHPVHVTLEQTLGQARLCVSDEGIGIAAGDAERIFGRFERAVSAQYYGGMGLGLFIARKIARAHGGSLWVESQVGRGSRFYVSLPRRQGFLAQTLYARRRKQAWLPRPDSNQ